MRSSRRVLALAVTVRQRNTDTAASTTCQIGCQNSLYQRIEACCRYFREFYVLLSVLRVFRNPLPVPFPGLRRLRLRPRRLQRRAGDVLRGEVQGRDLGPTGARAVAVWVSSETIESSESVELCGDRWSAKIEAVTAPLKLYMRCPPWRCTRTGSGSYRCACCSSVSVVRNHREQ